MRERMKGPLPTTIAGNRWTAIPLPPRTGFRPTLRASVVIPHYNDLAGLTATLRGLRATTYPAERLEIIVADDSPDHAPARQACARILGERLCEARVVEQDHQGFGAGRARNLGVRHATGDFVVFLDAGVVPEDGLLTAHALWHHTLTDALTLGWCPGLAQTNGDDPIGDRTEKGQGPPPDATIEPPWWARHLERTADLTSSHEDLFRAVTSRNLGIGRAFFEELGGFDEAFRRYGGEDTEFGYRAWSQGALLVPVRAAVAWHLGGWNHSNEGKAAALDRQQALLADRIPIAGFRTPRATRRFTRPRDVVTVRGATATITSLAATAERLLGDADADLAIRLQPPTDAEPDDVQWLDEFFEGDPRVTLADDTDSLTAYPNSPFHISIPANAKIDPKMPGALRRQLGDGVIAVTETANGHETTIARAPALHRARRTGLPVERFGKRRRLEVPRQTEESGRGRPTRGFANPRPATLRRQVRRVLDEARWIRGPRTTLRFCAWLWTTARWTLATRRTQALERSMTPEPGDPVTAGVRIATKGRVADRIFGKPLTPPADTVDPYASDILVADEAVDGTEHERPPVVLTRHPELGVPAFDPRLENPVERPYEVEHRVAALGPRKLLPAGVRATFETAAANRRRLRTVHHVVDTARFHRDPRTRAGTLAMLAARGIPVHVVDKSPELEQYLGSELYALMREPPGFEPSDARETRSIALRRAAQRTHSWDARAIQIGSAGLPDPPQWPLVSVIVPTRRPDRVRAAVHNVARQRYPNFELVLALHGDGFDARTRESIADCGSIPIRLIEVDEGRTLGSVLRAATIEARGRYIAKMDDDDEYGDEHLWDLALAQRYSGADLVSKYPRIVYLARRDITIRQRRVQTETDVSWAHGATLLVTRAMLDQTGGWQRRPARIDLALAEDVKRAGGRIYRTHDEGYVGCRHGDRHTWQREDDEFIADAELELPGYRPELAAIGRTRGDTPGR